MATRATPDSVRRPDWKTDAGLILLLLVSVATLRGVLVARTVVPARDSIGYIRYALDFERFATDGDQSAWQAWQTVLKRHHQHPAYSLTVLAVSIPVRAWGGGTNAETMQLSAQLASSLAALLLVWPMFLLGKMLFDRPIAFWGTLLFQVLPGSAHVLSDGLSEALFLLCSVTALLFAVQGLRDRSAPRFVLCGLFCGLSYLTRPEGALVLIAAGLVLGAAQLPTAWRWPWRRFVVAHSALLVTGVAVSALYWAATQRFTNKPSMHIILHGEQARRANDTPAVADRPPACLLASLWGASIKLEGSTPDRIVRGVCALGSELAQAFHYIGALPVLLGALWCWRRLRGQPGFWVMVTLCTLHAAVICALVVKVGYVSDRHVLLLVLCGSYLLAGGLCGLPERIRIGLPWRRKDTGSAPTRYGAASLSATAVVLMMVAACLPKTLQRLHYNRAGHHAAGLWLAGQLRPGDEVRDDHCWSHYYAGRVFREGLPVVVEPGHTATEYLVITRSRDPEIGPSRELNEKKVRDASGVLVYHWPPDKSLDAARVVVYSLSHQKCLEHGLLRP